MQNQYQDATYDRLWECYWRFSTWNSWVLRLKIDNLSGIRIIDTAFGKCRRLCLLVRCLGVSGQTTNETQHWAAFSSRLWWAGILCALGTHERPPGWVTSPKGRGATVSRVIRFARERCFRYHTTPRWMKQFLFSFSSIVSEKGWFLASRLIIFSSSPLFSSVWMTGWTCLGVFQHPLLRQHHGVYSDSRFIKARNHTVVHTVGNVRMHWWCLNALTVFTKTTPAPNDNENIDGAAWG